MLGPIFFFIYVNGLFENISEAAAFCFSDDTSPYLLSEFLETFKSNWFEYNKLTINLEKQNIYLYHSFEKNEIAVTVFSYRHVNILQELFITWPDELDLVRSFGSNRTV